MNISELNISKKQIIFLVVLQLGIIALVILVQQTQIFKPKASDNIYSAIEIKDNNGQNVCDGNKCNVSDTQVNLKFDIQRLEDIINHD